MPAGADRPECAATRWPLVFLLVLAGAAVAFQIGKGAAAIPLLRRDLGLGLVAAGWVLSMFNVLGALAGVAAGAVADRIGHRRAVLGGLGAVAAASLLGATASGAGLLLAGRFLEGLGFIVVVTAVPGLLVRAARPADHRLAFGLWSAYMPAGTAVMMLAAPLVLGPFGWRGLWLANGLLLAAFAGALALATRRLGPGGGGRRRGLLRAVARTVRGPGPVVLALVFGSYTVQFLSVLGFLPTVLVETEGFSPGRAAALTAAAIAANILGNLAGGGLLHRGAPRWGLVLATNLVMGLCGLGIYAAGLPVEARYALVVVFSAVGGLIPAAALAGAPVHAPAPGLVGTTTGLIMQGSNLGQAIGPPAVAALAAQAGGWQWSPAVLAAAAAAGCALALLLRRLEGGGATGPEPAFKADPP